MGVEPDVRPILREQLAHAERLLAAGGSPAPRDDALALLSPILQVPTALLLAEPERPMREREVATFADWIARRAAGEALPHITGHLPFMGLDLRVTPGLPLPAGCATGVVEAALERARHHAPGELLAAEIGTGCGAIALALAAFEPRISRIYALDASAGSLRVAVANGARYLLNLVISWIEGDGLDAVPEPVDLIVSASPGASPGARSEELALLAGQVLAKLRPGGALICGLDGDDGMAASPLLARTVPGAQVWMHAPTEGSAVVVAQLPHP